MKDYEINEETIAVIPINKEKTKIIEFEREYIIDKKAYKIMDESCQYYGSTYRGRFNAAKKLLNCSYKLPIIVEESQKVIFFPTKSSLEDDCCWINYNSIKNFEKTSNMVTKIRFYNNQVEEFIISKLSLENQLSRSVRLESILRKRSEDLIKK